MEGLVVILALSLAICIYVIVKNSNSREEALRAERKHAEEKYSSLYTTEKADYRRKVDKEYADKLRKLTSERDYALSQLAPVEEKNRTLSEQNSKYYLRICELEALLKPQESFTKKIADLTETNKILYDQNHAQSLRLAELESVNTLLEAHPELCTVFSEIASDDTTCGIYVDFLKYYLSNRDSIKIVLTNLVPRQYKVGEVDIVSHLSEKHIASVTLPDLSSVPAVSVKGNRGDYATSLVSCSCKDFQIRQRPCKHMLSLATTWNILWIYGSFINAEIDKRVRKLVEAEKTLHNEKGISEIRLSQTQRDSLIRMDSEYEQFKQKLASERQLALSHISDREKELNRLSSELKRKEKKLSEKETVLNEKLQSYPWLASRLADLEMLSISIRVRDAYTKAELTALLKRQTKEIAMLKNQLAVYEYLFPILEEFKEVPPQNIEKVLSQSSDEGFHYQWLSNDDYEVLTSREKSDRWIQRYFAERSKSAWEAGIKYERYIGYLCEQKGYSVKYNGAVMYKEDMGRDLIVSKGKNVYVVQCKRFSSDKEIHENHVFQLLGSVIHLRATQPNKTVTGVFVTSAQLSPVARECASIIGLQVYENVKFEQYPIIKCNIGRDGQRIYHLPYDQQYDRISIEHHKGELYCSSCAEAEGRGFRHAWKHYVS